MSSPHVLAVHRSPTHSFSKSPTLSIRLIAGRGIEGDAHAGETVKHRSRVARDPTQPNLRQVHLIHAELHDELNAAGFNVKPGDMGENITTRGLDLLALPTGTLLMIGRRSDRVDRPAQPLRPTRPLPIRPDAGNARPRRTGNLIRKAGVMGVVLVDGDVLPNDVIRVQISSRLAYSSGVEKAF